MWRVTRTRRLFGAGTIAGFGKERFEVVELLGAVGLVIVGANPYGNFDKILIQFV